MEKFFKSFKKLMNFEGQYTNDSADSGGATKYGISQRSYPELDIFNLTEPEAQDIYKREYWDPLHLDDWPDCNLTYNVFEFVVHSGIHRAVTALQIAINAIHGKQVLNEDGIFGSKSMEAILKCDLDLLNKCYKSAIGFYYYYLSVNRNKDKRFIRGWLNRAYAD